MSANGYRDYFNVLEVERGADADAIKRAFRKLARQYHPDVNPGDAGAEAKFKEVSEAYEVLSDPDKRRRYEQFGQYWSQAGGGSASGGVDVDFGRYGNFDDFINDLLGRFGGPSPGAAPGGFGFSSGFPGGFAGGPGGGACDCDHRGGLGDHVFFVRGLVAHGCGRRAWRRCGRSQSVGGGIAQPHALGHLPRAALGTDLVLQPVDEGAKPAVQ